MDYADETWKIICPWCDDDPGIKQFDDYTDDTSHLVQCKLCHRVFKVKIVRPIEYCYGKEEEFKGI